MDSTTINRLPRKVMSRVFAAVSLADLNKCAMVCKSWRDHINTKIGFKVVVGKSRHYDTTAQSGRASLPNYSVELISKIGIQSARIENMQEDNFSIFVFQFKYAQLVKSLIFDGKISSGQWNILLQPLTNLATLTISQAVLVDFNTKDSWLQFPNLQSLILTGRPPNVCGRCYNVDLIAEQWKHMIVNVVNLLKRAVTPRIQEIVLQQFQVNSGKQEDVVILYLCKFIIRNKSSLSKVSVAIQEGLWSIRLNSRLDKPLDVELQRLETLLPGLKLQSFFVHSTRTGSTRTQQLLHLILKSQLHNQLQHLVWKFQIDGVIYEPLPELVIRNNQLTLISIEMSVSPREESISCQVFANCTSLKFLTLIRGRRNAEGNAVEYITELIQANFLSKTLKSIRIFGFHVRNEDALFMSDQFQLDVLELKDIGETGGFGLPMNALENIFLKKNIELASFSKCWNSENLVGDGLFKLVMKIMDLQGQYYDEFLFKLVDDNYLHVFSRRQNPFSLSFYDYGDCERSKYFNNLELQVPIMDTGYGLFESNVELMPSAFDVINQEEEFEQELDEDEDEEGLQESEEDLVEEDLVESDEEVDVHVEDEQTNLIANQDLEQVEAVGSDDENGVDDAAISSDEDEVFWW